MSTNTIAESFLKWVDGKKQLSSYIHEYKRQTFNRYYRLFVDGGAVFMSLQYSNTIINDLNAKLIKIQKINFVSIVVFAN